MLACAPFSMTPQSHTPSAEDLRLMVENHNAPIEGQALFHTGGLGQVYRIARQQRRIRIGCTACSAQRVPCKHARYFDAKTATSGRQRNESTEQNTTPINMGLPSSLRREVANPKPPHHVDFAAPQLSIAELSWSDPTPHHSERHSLQFFINYTAPQISGLFDSSFWQHMVIRASYYEPSILHALIGIGSLHEGIVQCESRSDLERSPKYTFALQHLNKSIASIRAGRHGGEADLRKILTLCTLFTTFEALQGRTSDAMQHTLQGVRLFEAKRKRLAENPSERPMDDTAFPIATREISSVLAQFSFIAFVYRCMPGPVLLDARVPLPPAFASLHEAEQFLQDARNTITMLVVHCNRHEDPAMRVSSQVELHSFVSWLAKWKAAFDRFIATHYLLNSIDVKRTLILEANHRYCVCASSADQSKPLPHRYAPYEDMIRQTLELCEEALNIYSEQQVPTVASTVGPYLSYGMWLAEPLYLAMYYASNPEHRARAARLFGQRNRPESIAHVGPFVSGDKMLKPGCESIDDEENSPGKKRSASPPIEEAQASSTKHPWVVTEQYINFGSKDAHRPAKAARSVGAS